MNTRKLTKSDLDKVRDLEGFPIGSDENIIALSDAPYYTACPNPFIEEFVNENGTQYDEETDKYHCEPFAADVSEGKNDPIPVPIDATDFYKGLEDRFLKRDDMYFLPEQTIQEDQNPLMYYDISLGRI